MSVDSYNSDKAALQDSITKVYSAIKENSKGKSEYEDIHEETHHRSKRQEMVYHLVSAVAIVSVLFTIRRYTFR
jgi:hypothetical protein